MKDDSLGIYCVAEKKFFYLETGNLYVHNPVPRLRNTLQQRGLIDFNQSSYMSTSDYRIVQVKEAKLEGWDMEPIYISDHIKAMVQGDTEASLPVSKRSWGKKPVEPEAKAAPKKKRAKRKPAAKETQEAESTE